MKISLDIPDGELADATRFTNARTRPEAVVVAITDFNRRMRMAELIKYAGTCEDLMTPGDLRGLRRRD